MDSILFSENAIEETTQTVAWKLTKCKLSKCKRSKP